MSDDTDDKDGDDERKKNGKKKTPADRDAERARPEPVVKDPDLFTYLEELFWSEPESAHYPERIEVRLVSGRQNERLGPYIEQLFYAPPKAGAAAVAAGAGNPKPTREQLVAISNAMCTKMQRDCDQSRKAMTYAVMAWHMSRSDEPIARLLRHCTPKGKFTADHDQKHNPADEEGEDFQKTHYVQMLGHHQTMTDLWGHGIESHSMRQDRMIERLMALNEKLQDRVLQGYDIVERALSMESEREERREMSKLKRETIERGRDMAFALAPSLLNTLVSKNVLPSKATPETLTIKSFVTPKERGGVLEPEETIAVFGHWAPEPPHDLIKPGILTLDQGRLLFDVAECKIPPDEIERLLPGGDLMVTEEQAGALMRAVPVDKLAPILLIIDARMKRRQGAQ